MPQNAFTLIELLVVVLIIGILAAVAVPQYQFAVYKSRTAEARTNLQTLHNAQERYFLENGTYTTRINDLDISFPTDKLASSWNGTNAANPSTYMYSCNTGTGAAGCIANAANPNLPIIQYNAGYSLKDNGTYAPVSGKPRLYCLAETKHNKNATALKICKQNYNSTYSWGNSTYYVWN